MKTRKPQRGRPKADPDIQRSNILKATTEVLLQSGYQKATTLSIANACGISKNTLYNHFPSKEALFIALIENRATAMNDLLATALQDVTLDLADVLRQFGRLVLGVLTSDVSVAINRACMTAAGSGDIALSNAYFDFGQMPVRQKLVAVLKRARREEIIDFDDVNEPFQTLLGLYNGDLHVRRLLGVASVPAENKIEEKASKAVEKFMKLFKPHG